MKTFFTLILICIQMLCYGIQTKVIITTSQPDAKIYVDDIYKGYERYEFTTDLKIFIIRVEKSGYKTEVRRYMCKPLKDPGFIEFEKGAQIDVTIILYKEGYSSNSNALTKNSVSKSSSGTTKDLSKMNQPSEPVKTQSKETEKTKLTAEDVYKANTITFYGYDFSENSS